MVRQLHLLVAVLLTVLALAPGHAAADAQDHAEAFVSAAQTCTPPLGTESSCTRPGSKLGSARIAAGCCVATKGVPRAGASTLDDASQAAFKAAN